MCLLLLLVLVGGRDRSALESRHVSVFISYSSWAYFRSFISSTPPPPLTLPSTFLILHYQCTGSTSSSSSIFQQTRLQLNPSFPLHHTVCHTSKLPLITSDSLTHAHQPLDPHHPISTLLDLIPVNLHLDLARPGEITLPQSLAQLNHLPHRVRLQQVLVVQVVEQNVQPLLCVVDLRFVAWWGARLDPCHFL